MFYNTIAEVITLCPIGQPAFSGTPDLSVTPYAINNGNMSFMLMTFAPHDGFMNARAVPANSYALCRASAAATVKFGLFIHAFGRWK